MKRIIFLVLVLAFLAFAFGYSCCGRSAEEYALAYLPDGTKIVKNLGHGWFYIELDNVQYLYNSTRGTITSVPK